MATLDEKLGEMREIKAQLQRMEDDGEITEENDGDLRDTLIARWRKLDDECKPIIARMEEIKSITRARDLPGATEEGSDPGPGAVEASRSQGPDLVVRNRTEPYDCQELIRHEKQILMPRSELRERALDAIELEAKRGNLLDGFAEVATRRVQDGGFYTSNNVARHILRTGTEEYQDAFQAYLSDPQGEASRAALSLTNANGGFVTVAAA